MVSKPGLHYLLALGSLQTQMTFLCVCVCVCVCVCLEYKGMNLFSVQAALDHGSPHSLSLYRQGARFDVPKYLLLCSTTSQGRVNELSL